MSTLRREAHAAVLLRASLAREEAHGHELSVELTRAGRRIDSLKAAARLALSALDGLLGDSDLPEDDRPGVKAMQALTAALGEDIER